MKTYDSPVFAVFHSTKFPGAVIVLDDERDNDALTQTIERQISRGTLRGTYQIENARGEWGDEGGHYLDSCPAWKTDTEVAIPVRTFGAFTITRHHVTLDERVVDLGSKDAAVDALRRRQAVR